MIIRICVPKLEDILQEIEQPIKFSNQVFIGLLFSKIF